MPSHSNNQRPRITRQRLWYLYCLVGLTESDIEKITGWPRQEIEARLRTWGLTFLSPVSRCTNRFLERRIERSIVHPLNSFTKMELVASMREQLRDAVLDNPVDWDCVDRLRWLPQIEAEASSVPPIPQELL